MRSNWRTKTALWAAMGVVMVGGVYAAVGDIGPDVEPVYFALPLQSPTGNPVDCTTGGGQTLGLGYPIGVRIDGNGIGEWDLYIPLSGTGYGVSVPHGAPAPGGAMAFAGTIDITSVAGDSNSINFESTFGVNGVIVKAGSQGNPQASSVYAYVQPPNVANLQTLGWPNPENPYTGALSEDDDLDSPPNTGGVSHVDVCLDPQPTVTKTVDLSWKRWQDWTLVKTVNGQPAVSFELDVGEDVDVTYEVVATPVNQQRRFRAEGVVVISDPLKRGFALSAVTDTIVIDGNPFVATLGNKGGFESFACAPVNDGTSAIFSCAYAIELASADYPNLAAGDTVINTADVTLSLNGQDTNISYTTPATLFAVNPDASYGDTLAVDDDLLPANPDHTFPTGGPWTYPMNFACPDPGDQKRVNTVTGTYTTPGGTGSVMDSATVDLRCFALPTVDKTADGSATREFTWDFTKAVTPTDVTMYDGDSHALEYTIEATRSAADNKVSVNGVITIRDAAERAFQTPSGMAINDVVTFGGQNFPAAVGACQPDATAGDGVIFTCPYSLMIDADSHPGVDFGSGVNHVHVDLTKADASKTYALDFDQPFTVAAPVVTGDSLTVVDPMAGAASPHVFTDSGAWMYGHLAECDPARQESYDYTIDNTATGTYGNAPPIVRTASVDVHCRTVEVTKDATTRYDRDYDWDANKHVVVDPADTDRVENQGSCLVDPIASGPYAGFMLCDDVVLNLPEGGTYQTVYRLQANRSIESESGFKVSGSIGIAWPAGAPLPVFTPPTPADALHFDGGATQPVTPSCGAMGATTLDCTYDATVAGKTGGYNEASVTRQRQCYDAQGMPSACNGTSQYVSNQAPFAFGEPAAVTDDCASLDDLFNAGGLNLGNSFGWVVADEVCDSHTAYVTGDISVMGSILGSLDILADWIPQASIDNLTCEFMVPNVLNVLFNGQSASDESIITVKVPSICNQGCTYTQGYWKTHANYAAKPQFAKKRDATWDLIGADAENTVFYGGDMSYIQVMWMPPKGNAYYQLAHQYIAAKLNTLMGTGALPATQQAIAQAEALFLAHGNPTDGWWKNKNNRQLAITLAGMLAAYNEGSAGIPHCSVDVPSMIAAQQ